MFASSVLLSLVLAAAPQTIKLEGGAELSAYLATGDKATSTGVVVCPGGGYGFLANDHEGKQIAEFLNTLGVSAFVLKYTIVSKEQPGPLLRKPLTDVQNAIRHVRANAKSYKLDPQKIGIMGFSAGGHLASTAATHFAKGESVTSCRPDFAILAYPVISMELGVTHGGSRLNLLGKNPDAKLVEEFSNDKQVTKETPPTFLFHTDEDKSVLPENSVRFYLALKKAGIPAELHIYEKGKHGVGLGTDPNWTNEAYAADWSKRLASWLKLRGLLNQ
jgi:acetyl esterase/lipase